MKALTISILVICAVYLAFDQSRSFYCLSDARCITVWKRVGGACYVVNGKYYGLFKPSKSFLKTTNTQSFTFYFIDEFPTKIFVKDQGSTLGGIKNFIIKNKNIFEFIEYDPSIDALIYQDGTTKFNEVRESVGYIDLDIKENYAVDKYGRKIE
jgi:hypothetical protein